MLKHIPKNALERFEDTLLYSKINHKLLGSNDRRPNNDNIKNNGTDDNLEDRIDKFSDLIRKKIVYRIPLRFLVGIGLVNFLIAFDTRFIFPLEQDLHKLFQLKAKANPKSEHVAKIII